MAVIVQRVSSLAAPERRAELVMAPCRIQSACDTEAPFHRWKQELHLPFDSGEGERWELAARVRSNFMVYDRKRARACLDSEIFEKLKQVMATPDPERWGVLSSKLQDEYPTSGLVFAPAQHWCGRWRAPVAFCGHDGEILHLHVSVILSLLNAEAGAVDQLGTEEPQALFVKFHGSAKADKSHECCVCWDGKRALYAIGDPVAVCVVANYGAADLCVEDGHLVALGPGLWGAVRRGSCARPLNKFLDLSGCALPLLEPLEPADEGWGLPST